ncbi:MAG: sigma-54-dependent transcriptional regulator [Planctomycetaceae bacterium]
MPSAPPPAATPAPDQKRVLIVEDEKVIRTTLAEFLNSEGYTVSQAGSVAEALELAKSTDFHAAVCDVRLPDGDGIGLLKKLQQIHASTFVLIITAYASVEVAIDAFKSGAFDFLIKPVRFEEVQMKLERVFQFRALYRENQLLRRELNKPRRFDRIVGSSKPLSELLETIAKIAVTQSNVLLMGETGTGKETFARAIHDAGPKRDEKFQAINCGNRPVEALEAELFGTQGGKKDKDNQPGVFRSVGPGSVYLDEVAELPMGTQQKLLRAIEQEECSPVGGTHAYPVQARIIAATNADLAKLVSEGKFQEDLFYRLDGVKIRIPPLRERIDDIPELVDYFIAKHSETMGKRVQNATSETVRLLMSAQWKGNVRQLDNAIERAVMMCDATTIEPNDLPPDLLGLGQPLPDTDDLRSALRHYERLHITRVLRQWPDKKEAAKRLKLGLSSLYRKIEELDIEV